MGRPRHVIPAVVTALNLNGLGVVRSLGRNGVPVIGVDNAASGPELATRHLTDIWRPMAVGRDALLALLIARGRERSDRPVLFAITDESVSMIAEHHDALLQHYRVPFGTPEMVRRLLDKRGIDEFARQHGVLVPATWIVESRADVARAADQLRFPCVLKPQVKDDDFRSTGVPKANRLEDRDALLATYDRIALAAPKAVVQEFVPGGDRQVEFCLTAMSSTHEPLATFTARKLRQWPPLCGGTAACEPIDAPDLEEATVRFARAAKMTGIFGAEFKRDPRDGRVVLIEPTVCRPDWQNAIADLNGRPLPYLVWCDATGTPQPSLPARPSRRKWVDFGKDLKSAARYRQTGELSRLGWLWSVRPPMRPAWLSLEDPGPFLAIVRRKIRRQLAKIGFVRTE